MRLAGAFDAGRQLVRCCCLCWLLVSSNIAAASAPSHGIAPRYLLYPQPGGSVTKVQLIFGLGIPMDVDVSTIVGYVMKCNYNLPYNASYLAEPYVRYDRSAAYSSEDLVDESSSEQTAAMVRNDIYQIIEAAISSGSESEGKPCLLRAICEVAATPLNTRHGIFAQLLHIFFTPSSTVEPIDQEYLAAERIGGRGGGSRECAHAFAECHANFLEYFSKIH